MAWYFVKQWDNFTFS